MRALIILLMMSVSAFADPGDGRTKEERKKARIDRQIQRKQQPFDQRTRNQKRRDRNVLIFMAISAGLIVKSMSGE